MPFFSEDKIFLEPKYTNSNALLNPIFLLAVTLLLANDFFLKQAFPGFLTGKLSDVAGLWAFPYFWASCIPRYRRTIYVVTALLFTLWKLPISDGIIQWWNNVSQFPIGRVTDLTDLLALAVLPHSYLCLCNLRQPQIISSHISSRIGIAIICLFAFTATSRGLTTRDFDHYFNFQGSSETLLDNIKELGILVWRDGPKYTSKAPPGSLALTFYVDDICPGPAQIRVIFFLSEKGDQAEIHLIQMSHRCGKRGDDKQRLYKVFEEEIVKKLGLQSIS